MTEIKLSFSSIAEAVAFLTAGMAATGATGIVVEESTQIKPDTQQAVKAAVDMQQAITKAAAEGQTKPAKVKADPTPAATEVAKPAATSPTAAAVAVDVPATKALDYATDVSPKIATAAKHNRAAVVAALSKFGVAKGTELTPDQWPEFIAAMDAILAV